MIFFCKVWKEHKDGDAVTTKAGPNLITCVLGFKNAPFPSVSNKLKAWRSSSISSSVMPGLEVEEWGILTCLNVGSIRLETEKYRALVPVSSKLFKILKDLKARMAIFVQLLRNTNPN